MERSGKGALFSLRMILMNFFQPELLITFLKKNLVVSEKGLPLQPLLKKALESSLKRLKEVQAKSTENKNESVDFFR